MVQLMIPALVPVKMVIPKDPFQSFTKEGRDDFVKDVRESLLSEGYADVEIAIEYVDRLKVEGMDYELANCVVTKVFWGDKGTWRKRLESGKYS